MKASEESKQAPVLMPALPLRTLIDSLTLCVKEETNVLELQTDRQMHQVHVATSKHQLFR